MHAHGTKTTTKEAEYESNSMGIIEIKGNENSYTVKKPFKCESYDISTINDSIPDEHRNIRPDEKLIKQEETNDDPPIVSNPKKRRTEKPAASASITREHRDVNPMEKLIKQEVSDDDLPLVNNPKMQRSVVSEKPYKCDLCDFTAVRPSIVKVHRKIHSGESPVKRGVGDYVSAQQLRNIKGEKPCKCNLCSFGTIHSSILEMHKRIHITENN